MVLVLVCVCDVDRSCEGKRWDLLGFKTLNVEAPLKSIFEGLPLLYKDCIIVVVFRRRDRSKGRTILVERERERTLGEWEGDSRTREGVWESKEERRRRERERLFYLKRNLG